MENINVIKKSGLYFIGNLSSKLLSAAALPVYAFFISAESLGYYDYSQSIMSIVLPFSFLAIWEAILKFILEENNSEIRQKIIASSAWFSIAACIVLCTALFVYSMLNPINHISYISAMFCSSSVAQIWQYYARGLKYNKIYVISGIASSAVCFASVLVFVCIIKSGLAGLYLSYIIGQAVIILIVETNVKIHKNMRFSAVDMAILKSMIKFSAPLVLNLISAWLLNGFSGFLIKNLLGAKSNGQFAFANKFSAAVTMLGSVVTMAIIEEALFSRHSKDFAASFSLLLENLLKIFQLIVIAAIPIVAVFYSFIDSTEYSATSEFVPPLLLFSMIMTMASNISAVFYITGKTSFQMLTTVFGGVAAAVISLCLITGFGINGVIAGQLAGAAVMLLLRYIYAHRTVGVNIRFRKSAAGFPAYIALSCICFKVGWHINIIIFSAIVLYIALFYRSAIKGLVKSIKRKGG